jgi:hypothetical protein
VQPSGKPSTLLTSLPFPVMTGSACKCIVFIQARVLLAMSVGSRLTIKTDLSAYHWEAKPTRKQRILYPRPDLQVRCGSRPKAGDDLSLSMRVSPAWHPRALNRLRQKGREFKSCINDRVYDQEMKYYYPQLSVFHLTFARTLPDLDNDGSDSASRVPGGPTEEARSLHRNQEVHRRA